ncbi:MucR family transcriptional regulator (plasmid) [Sinorhizobium medicae]|nr:MucR family transcriptional regulator [Sinorhizobium medicae]
MTVDFIICLEDGEKFKSLRRHLMDSTASLRSNTGKKWGLPDDYRMIAPS